MIKERAEDVGVRREQVETITTLTRERDEARAKLTEVEALTVETDALRTMLLLNQRELDAIRDRHRTYADGIARVLEPVRIKRETGEPARSDREEIEALIQARDEVRARPVEVNADFPMRDIVFAATIHGGTEEEGPWLVTLVCGHKVAVRKRRVSYPCGECRWKAGGGE